MSLLKFLLLIQVLSFYFLSIVSDCLVNYPESIESVPRYEKHIGKYKLHLPYNGKHIRLEENDVISGFCDTQFRSFDYYDNWYGDYSTTKLARKDLTSLELTCKDGKLRYDNYLLSQSIIDCEKRYWSIYETNDSHLWCERNQNSSTFLLGTKSTVNHHILAGICYNLEQLSLQTVNYNLTYSPRNPMEMLIDIRNTNLESNQTLSDELGSFKTTKFSELSNELLQQQLTEMSKINSWLHLANFEVASIVQGDLSVNYFKEYDNVLNIIWWHNLRLGNWKRFMNTLENYAYNNSFELFTGTSDVVRFPTDTKCKQNDLLEIKVGFKNETVPGYIWTYLKSNDNLNQNFVVVGYNSPYAEFFSLENVIFCPDICSEIPWLSEIQSQFHYAFAGILFCCSTDFMKQTNHLNGFPMDVLTKHHSEYKSDIDVTTDIGVTMAVEETTIYN